MKYIIKNLYIAIIMALLLNSNAYSEAESPKNNNQTAEVDSLPEFKLGPGDILEISVWKEVGLYNEVRVRPDGGITFPLVGEVQAGGRSAAQLQQELVSKIKRFIPDPVVTVSVMQVISNHIFVIGKVNRPTDFTPPAYVNVMQALTMAGGLNAFAKAGDIKILRRVNGKEISIPLDYGDVANGDNLKQNIFLRDGDVVVVP